MWVELDSKPKNKKQKQMIVLGEVSTGEGAVNIHLRTYKDRHGKEGPNDMAGTHTVLAWVGGGFLLRFYFVVLGSAFVRLNLLLYEPEKENPPKKPPTTQTNPFFTVFSRNLQIKQTALLGLQPLDKAFMLGVNTIKFFLEEFT